MKKPVAIVYVVLCLVICLIPFAGMAVAPTETTTENKTLASFPTVTEDGKVNLDFFDELGAYFEDHFAFREAFVDADAEIQSKVFGVSNVDTIITGTDGWLYYSATLDDYLGQDLLSDRSVYNSVHNLKLMQDYVESQGAKFAVTVAPNKNSLYGEHMPYYDSYIVSHNKNVDLFAEKAEEQNVNYIDLFAPFEETNEVLYLDRDSHWNGRGAVLAYNEILNEMEVDHDYLDTVPVERTNTEIGDLNSMIYPLTAQPEWNYTYDYETNYRYTSDVESVEDAWITTENEAGDGSLLMFRDSFGNTLLPLMANTFSAGSFSWGTPYLLGPYMETSEPDVVIVEKVERNLDEFTSDPPVMQALETELEAEPEITLDDDTTCLLQESENVPAYLCISGCLDEANVEPETRVYVQIQSGGQVYTMEAFLETTEESDYGYRCYLKKEYLSGLVSEDSSILDVNIVSVSEDSAKVVCQGEFDMAKYAE